MDENAPVLKDRNLHLIFIITLFAVMGVASIAPAFPQIIRYFNISESEVGWLVVSFTLPGIFLTPAMGILADRLGRKNILIPSLILFGVAGFGCIFTRTFHHLLVLRFLQGIGAASLGLMNVTLIGDLFAGHRRIKAMGYNTSVLSIGTAGYPALGGMMAMAGWFYPFVLPVLAVPLGIYIALKLKVPSPEPERKLGAYLRNTWKNINQRSVWGLFLLNILAFFLIYGACLTYLPLLMETRLSSTSFTIGLVMSLASASTAIVAAFIGRINKLFGPQRILLIGIGFYLTSMTLYAFSSSYWFIVLPALFYGIGQGMVLPTTQTLLVGYAPFHERAAFMSINSMVLRIGQTAGPMVIGFAFALGGVQYAFLGGSAVAAIMFGITVGMVRKP